MYKAPVRYHLVSLGACVFPPPGPHSWINLFELIGNFFCFVFQFLGSCIGCPSLWIWPCMYLSIHAFFSFFIHVYLSLLVNIGRFFIFHILCLSVHGCMSITSWVSGWCCLGGRCSWPAAVKGLKVDSGIWPIFFRELLEGISRLDFYFVCSYERTVLVPVILLFLCSKLVDK